MSSGLKQKLVKAGQQKKEELVVVSPWKRTASKKKINSTVRKQELKGNRAVTAMKAKAFGNAVSQLFRKGVALERTGNSMTSR